MKWIVLRTFDNTALADLTAGRLNNNGVQTRIDYGAYRSGVDGVRLYIPREQVRQAEQLLAETALTEEELTQAALNAPDPEHDKPS